MISHETIARAIPPTWSAPTEAWVRELLISNLTTQSLLVELAAVANVPVSVTASDLTQGVLAGVGSGRESLAATVLMESPGPNSVGKIGGQ